MKRLIWLALLLPYFATAQINGTIQKTVATGTVRGSFGSLGLDTLPRVTGILLNGRVLTYNSVLNKWTASMAGTSSIDTTQIRTVANSVSLAGLQTRLNAYLPLTGGTLSGALTSTATGQFIQNTAAGTTTKQIRIGHTNADLSLGVEGSTPSIIPSADGGVANSSVLKTVAGTDLILGTFSKAALKINGTTQATTLLGGLTGTTGTFSGVLSAPTATAGTNTTQVATTAFVTTAVGSGSVWTRTGTTLSPTTAGDYVSITTPASGTAIEVNATSGSSNGISIATTANGYGTRINNSGTSYASSMNISGASSSGSEIVLGSTNGVGINLNAGSGYTGTPLTYSKNSSTLFNVSNAGNLSISGTFSGGGGTLTTSAGGSITGAGNIVMTGVATFSSLGTGTVYSNASTLTNTNPSDSTLKNTIKPLQYGLDEVLKLQPKTFYYNSDSTKSSLKYGFIAQEVQPIMPDIVRKISKDSDKLGLESDGIYVTLVKAIQELSAKLEAAEARIKALELKQ